MFERSRAFFVTSRDFTQEPGIDYDTCGPTLNASSITLFRASGVKRKMRLRYFDIQQDFVQTLSLAQGDIHETSP